MTIFVNLQVYRMKISFKNEGKIKTQSDKKSERKSLSADTTRIIKGSSSDRRKMKLQRNLNNEEGRVPERVNMQANITDFFSHFQFL